MATLSKNETTYIAPSDEPGGTGNKAKGTLTKSPQHGGDAPSFSLVAEAFLSIDVAAVGPGMALDWHRHGWYRPGAVPDGN